jgi:hypothetical protein
MCGNLVSRSKAFEKFKLFMNAGPRLLARGIEGAAWVTLPSALEAKKACVNIQNEETLPHLLPLCLHAGPARQLSEINPDRVSNYQVGKLLKSGKRSNSVMVPINVGLDFTAIDVPRVDVTDQLLAFEEANDLGVYIYQWEEKNYGHGRDARHAASLPHALSPPQAGMHTAPTQEPLRVRATLSAANVLH